MPCLWLKHNNSQIFVKVGIIDASIIVDLAGEVPPNLQNHMFQALVDTGAQITMISKRAADKVGLRPIGMTSIIGVGGVREHRNYLFHVAFVLKRGEVSLGKMEVDIHMFGDVIEGAELSSESEDFDILLGMDVLSKCSLAIEGNGTFSLSF